MRQYRLVAHTKYNLKITLKICSNFNINFKMQTIQYISVAAIVNICCLLTFVISSDISDNDENYVYQEKCNVFDTCKKEWSQSAKKDVCESLNNLLTRTVECLPQSLANQLNPTKEKIENISLRFDSSDEKLLWISNQTNVLKKQVERMDEQFGKEIEKVINQTTHLKKDIDTMKADIKEMKQLQREVITFLRAEVKSQLTEVVAFIKGNRIVERGLASVTELENEKFPADFNEGLALIPKDSCDQWLQDGSSMSTVYKILPKGPGYRFRSPVKVFCDMEDDGGGWTVIQRRGTNKPATEQEIFYRNWRDYELGFGNPTEDYWLGLENISLLTRAAENELMIILTSWNGTSVFAKYSKFKVSGRKGSYRLSIGRYSNSSTGGDEMQCLNGIRFTTVDNDNDNLRSENSARIYKGGWWYNSCSSMNLNGERRQAEDGSEGQMATIGGIDFRKGSEQANFYYSYMKTEMKIRPIYDN